MITFDQAKTLRPGQTFLDENNKKWRVNGKVKLWKTQPNRISIPVKRGLYEYGYITESNLWAVTLKGE